MRVLLLTQYFWPETFPINTLVEHLEREGADLTVLTAQPNYPGGAVFAGYTAASVRRERFGTRTDVFRVPILPRGSAGGVRLALNYASFVASASLLGPWLLRGREFDVVFVYAPSPIVQSIAGVVMKWFKHAPLATWVQDLWPESLESTGHVRNPTLLRLAGWLVRWIYASNDRLMGQSPDFVDAIRPLAGTTPVDYLPNPGEPSFITPATVESPVRFPQGFNIVFAGNLGTVQALDTILDAAEVLAPHEQVNILLVGDGSRADWARGEIWRRGLRNVTLPGRFDASTMPAVFARADALLVTLNRSDILRRTIPSKVQMYLAAGRPIIASLDGAGADLIVRAGAGLASPAGDVPALAANIRRMAAMPAAKREELGRAGRAYYDAHFDPAVLARDLLAQFAVMCGRAGTSLPASAS